MKKVELLAPAGSFACLKAAINNGANACYLGGKNFSARAFANNFDEEELIEAVKYAHLRDVKIYVTLNTLLNQNEFNNALKMVDFYYQNNVDALLIQDLGLYYYIKNKYPDFELHCSTQMHVHNLEGLKTAKKLGFKRVVIPRESNLEFIHKACQENIEIETFVHGAICSAYSGQCLMSSYTKNRSANKGMCAQCCRLKYELYDENDNLIPMHTNYPLSSKDMCLINDLPSLIEAGVSSFKIEGRLKSSAYVGYVTSIYRKAIDSYYEGKKYQINEEELNNLKVLFNRSFTNDYLYNKYDLFNQETPNHLGILIGEVLYNKNGFTYLKLSKPLNQFDGIRINDFGCICNMIYKNGLLTNFGNINDVVAIETKENLKGKVYKTLDYLLEKEVNESSEKHLPIDLDVELLVNSKAKVKINDFNYESEILVQKALKQPLSNENILNCFKKLNNTPFYLNKIDIKMDNAFLSISQLNELRREAISKYIEYKLNCFKRQEIRSEVDYLELNNEDNNLREFELQEDLIQDFVVNLEENDNLDKSTIMEFGALLNKNVEKIAYYSLNCSNSYCYEFFKKLGFNKIILSSELNSLDIENLKNDYLLRNNKKIYPYIISSENRVLMYLKGKPFDQYMSENKKYYLKANNNRYLIRQNHNITELINIDNQTDIRNYIYKQLFTIV